MARIGEGSSRAASPFGASLPCEQVASKPRYPSPCHGSGERGDLFVDLLKLPRSRNDWQGSLSSRISKAVKDLEDILDQHLLLLARSEQLDTENFFEPQQKLRIDAFGGIVLEPPELVLRRREAPLPEFVG